MNLLKQSRLPKNREKEQCHVKCPQILRARKSKSTNMAGIVLILFYICIRNTAKTRETSKKAENELKKKEEEKKEEMQETSEVEDDFIEDLAESSTEPVKKKRKLSLNLLGSLKIVHQPAIPYRSINAQE